MERGDLIGKNAGIMKVREGDARHYLYVFSLVAGTTRRFNAGHQERDSNF